MWESGREFYRCYDASRRPWDFHAGDDTHRSRFAPFTPEGGRDPVPVVYGASDVDGAVFETVFHDVPVRGVARVPRSKLVHRLLIGLLPLRPLTLVDMTSEGGER